MSEYLKSDKAKNMWDSMSSSIKKKSRKDGEPEEDTEMFGSLMERARKWGSSQKTASETIESQVEELKKKGLKK